MNMPFGKYKGVPLSRLPADYLAWLLTLPLRDPLGPAVRLEVQAREGPTEPPPRPQLPETCPSPEAAAAIVAAGRRALAKRHHPDVVHGSHESMVSLNLAAEWLNGQIDRGGLMREAER